ncbi:MAG: transglutaminase family protein [Marinilabiliaceae bacterium]|nr:transglutaminase family protein [Marinilabiliaceae bacterium]
MNKKKIEALISLLDDSHNEVFNAVEQELLKCQVEIVPLLEHAWEQSVDELFQLRIENIIHQIQFKNIRDELAIWIENGATDLLYGAYLVSKYRFPGLDYSWVENQINELRKDIWFELSEKQTSMEKVKVINHIMFDVYKFSRNNINILAVENNYISEVFLTKKGNPISLSVIYSVVCQRLGIPVYGVNLPRNFILAYLDVGESSANLMTNLEVMFYINPINKGAVLGRREIEFFLKQQRIQPSPSYFLPCKSNEEIVKRMFSNLLYAFETSEEIDKVKEISELISIFKNVY